MLNVFRFNEVGSDILRLLVISRIANPVSKLKTAEYLKSYHNVQLGKDQIYRYLDKLYSDHKEQIQQISYTHTLKILGGVMSIVFYDVTTLYFQIGDEDEIRKRGIIDKMVAVFFNSFSCLGRWLLFLCCQAKRKRALLESNPPGIYLMTDEKVKRKGVPFRDSFYFFRSLYAFKNSSINFFFLSMERPL